MARRRSFMATRMSKMRGLDRNEKQILVQIGEIVDSAVNNRTPTNPTGTIRKANKSDPRLPAVGNLNVRTGVRSVKIQWEPVDGTILENYAITITNLGTGVTTENISYTSSFVFKGESGDYKALVKPIGRNGVAAPVREILFTIADSVMILEGAKNGTSTEGTFVSDVVLTPQDYQVFAWGAFVLNSFASPVQNNSPIVQLRYGDDLNTSALIQEIEMFPESETATNLNDIDYGGILRPAGGPNREGNFETSHTVMFAPFEIPDSIANQSTRFWFNVTNRDIEADVISASIVLWVGSGGRGELGVTPVATVNPRSINCAGTAAIYLAGIPDKTSGDLEDEFTIAMWVKPLNLETAGSFNLFRLEPFEGAANFFPNRIDIGYSKTGLTYALGIGIYNSIGSILPINQDIVSLGATTLTLLDLWTNGNLNWNFITIVWNRAETGVDRLKFYMNGVEVVTAGSVTVTNDGATMPDIDRDLTVVLPNPPNDYMVFYTRPENATIVPSTNARFNSSGIWNSALTAAEILTLYNNGAGANVDWRNNSGNYVSSANLSHYWLFGFDTSSNLAIAADYGNSLFPFNMNYSYDLNFLPVFIPYSPLTTSDVVTDAPV